MSDVDRTAKRLPPSNSPPSRRLAVAAGLSGSAAVVAGAFGAHAASGVAAEWLRTGAQYQLVHAVAAVAIARSGSRLAPALLLIGGAIFGGTLYLMAAGLPRWLGAVTPIGGAFLIAGWLAFAAGARRAR